MADRDVLIQIIIKAARQGATEAIKALLDVGTAQQAAAATAQEFNSAMGAMTTAATAAARSVARLATAQSTLGAAMTGSLDIMRRNLRQMMSERKKEATQAERDQAADERLLEKKQQQLGRELAQEIAFNKKREKERLDALEQNKRFDEQALRAAEKAAEAQRKAREALLVGFGKANIAVRDFTRRALGGLARALIDLINPINYVTRALSGLWDILKRALGYALGRGLVALIKDPIGALQQLGEGVFGLTTKLDTLQIQLGVMLPKSSGTAATAMQYLWDMVLRTSASIDDLSATMRILTAQGIDYRQWMEVLADVSAGSGRSMEQLGYAIGLVNQGMATGLRYLKQAGINIKELGIQQTKAGRLIGNTTDIITKLFYALQEQYGGMSAEIGKTFNIVLQNLADFASKLWTNVWGPLVGKEGVLTKALRSLYAQFIDLDKRAMTPLGESMEALSQVVGEKLAGAFVKLQKWVGDTLRGMQMDLMGFAQWAANLTAAIANGILTGINRYLIPAISAVVQILADFLSPGSPPKRGLLHYIDKWGIALFEEYLKGFALADFDILSEATGILRNILTTMAATGDVDEEDIPEILARTRTQIAELLSGFRATGVWDEELLADIVDQYGRWGDEVEDLIRLHVQLTAEQEKLEALEEERAGVQDEIRETILRMRREGYTEEAIQAWRQWFEAGRLGQLDEQIDAQRDIIDELEEELSWQQALINAQMEQIDLVGDLLKALDKVAKKLKEVAKGLVLGPTPQFEIDIPKLTGALDELKEEWEDIFDELFKPFERLEENLRGIGDFLRGLLGALPPPAEGEMETGALVGQVTEAWLAGEKFREALDTIRLEILPFLARTFEAIAKSADLTYNWWNDVKALLGEGGDLGWLGALLKAGAQEIALFFSVTDPETGDTYLNMILLALGLLGLVTVGPKALLLAVVVTFAIEGAWPSFETLTEQINAAINPVIDGVNTAIIDGMNKLGSPLQEAADATIGEAWRTSLAAVTEAWNTAKAEWLGPGGTIPTLISEAKTQWTGFRTWLNGQPNTGIPALIFGAQELWRGFKKWLVGDEGIVPLLIADIVGFFEDLYTELLDGEDAWINKFVEDAKEVIASLLSKVEHLINRILKLIGLGGVIGIGGDGDGNTGQFGAYVAKAGQWLLHRGEYVLNPDYPRPDLLAAFLRDIAGSIGRWMPDMDAAFGSLSMPTFAPSIEMAGGGGSNVVHNYYIRSLALQMERGRSLEKTLRELSKLGGIGVG